VFPLHPIEGARCGCRDPGCRAIGKHPITTGWPKAIASVAAAESSWGERFGERGLGLACGPRAGCFGFDVDPRHGGDKSLAELVAAHGKLPRTWAAESGSGGLHLFFAWPEDGEVRNSAGKVGPGLDVRGDGGFMVLPPSRHRNGNRNRWVAAPESAPLSSAPAWLLALIRGQSGLARQRARVPAAMVPAGHRHDALVSLLGLMRRWGACEQVLDAAAVAFVEHQCLVDPTTPISLAHVHATARDIARRY
jgi:Bifunctional DNA primase/polymerase, N-terminal